MLFDQKPRNYIGPRRYSESYYVYIDRSVRKDCEHIRQILNDWFSHFPTDHQKELKRRFSLPYDDFSFLSAFFELYHHELLLRLGFEIDYQSKINETSKRPDFLVKSNKKPMFFLECTLSLGSKEEINTEKIKKELYDEINRIYNPDFSITPTVHGIFKAKSYTWPPIKKWCKSLEKELIKLDPGEIEVRLKKQGLTTLSYCSKEFDGLSISIQIELKALENREKPGIPNTSLKMQRSEEREAEFYIKKAIKKKVRGYEGLTLPYIIAINIMHHFCFDSSIAKALFGQKLLKNMLNLRNERNLDGIWWGQRDPQNTRVSAVLIFKRLRPWNIIKQTPMLWHNPWANIPLTPDIWALPQKVYNDKGEFKEYIKGKSAGEVFDLPPN